jgi:long-chain acyl-CoA synthetase
MVGIQAYLENKCTQFGNNRFLVFEKLGEVSYADFYDNITKAKAFYSDLNRNKFSFCILSDNCPQYLYSLFALQFNSGVAVNLNPMLSDVEVEKRLALTNVRILVCSEKAYARFEEFIGKYGADSVYVFKEESLSFEVRQLVKNEVSQNAGDLAAVQASYLQFTGGTTGSIKSAEISYKNILANLEQLDRHIASYIETDNLRVLVAFPFYHIFSIVFNVLFFMQYGSTLVVYRQLRDTEGIMSLFISHQPNFTVGVNTWYKKLMQMPAFDKLDFSHIRACIAGGEYVPISTKLAWKQKTGKNLFSGYGLTETSSLAIVSPLDEQVNIDDSIGVAIPDTSVALLSDNNQWITEDNQPGEILLKGPQVTSAYFNSAEETEKAFYDAWFRTGDVAIRTHGKFYKIVDRKKDMISVSGNKVYPNEVEEAILQIPEVMDVAAVGKYAERSGEQVVVYVVLQANSKVREEDVIQACQARLARFKVPKQVIFVEELPKTPIGKTSRKHLRDLINKV